MKYTDYTPLPAKYTPSSILKLHDRLLAQFMKDMLDFQQTIMTKEEKNKRISNAVKWIKLIHDYTMSGEMTYKKHLKVR
jgi:hypothetical protein